MKKELIVSNEDKNISLSIIEQVVIQGDLAKLTPEERVTYYKKVCESLGLNPLTKPFAYINLSGKLTLYASKDCTEQLRKINGVSIEGLDDKIVDDIYIVKAKAKDKHGRTDESTGAVNIGNLKGEAKANAFMKAETKAKRRVTLSISGLGWCDETEVDTIPGAQKVPVNIETGEVLPNCEILSQINPIICENLNDNCVKTTQSDTISIQQLDEIERLEAKLDKKTKENFLLYLKEKYNISDLCNIPSSIFQNLCGRLQASININKS